MSAVIDVAFIVVGGPKLLPKAQQTAEHLAATSSLPVHVHLVTDKRLPQQPWFRQHLLSALPAEPAALHRNLSKLGVGPSFIYMYKPFLYQLLPLDRVLVLDFDVLIFGDLRELWDQFDAFSPSSVLGLAHSQSPEYSELGTWPHKPGPRAGLNGGVQLQHLARMRADAAAGGAYLRDLRRCAAGGCKRYWKLPRLGDQVRVRVRLTLTLTLTLTLALTLTLTLTLTRPTTRGSACASRRRATCSRVSGTGSDRTGA